MKYFCHSTPWIKIFLVTSLSVTTGRTQCSCCSMGVTWPWTLTGACPGASSMTARGRGCGSSGLSMWVGYPGTWVRPPLAPGTWGTRPVSEAVCSASASTWSSLTSCRRARGRAASCRAATSATPGAPAAMTRGRGWSGSGRGGERRRSGDSGGGSRDAGRTGAGGRAPGPVRPRAAGTTGASAGGATPADTASGPPPAGRRKQGNMSRRTAAGIFFHWFMLQYLFCFSRSRKLVSQKLCKGTCHGDKDCCKVSRD